MFWIKKKISKIWCLIFPRPEPDEDIVKTTIVLEEALADFSKVLKALKESEDESEEALKVARKRIGAYNS